jgi:hypothetical protein
MRFFALENKQTVFSTSLSLFLSSHFYGGAFSCMFLHYFNQHFSTANSAYSRHHENLASRVVTSDSLFGKFRWHFKGIVHTVMI